MKYYVYVLLSQKDNKLYVGQTSDLQRRIQAHNLGKVKSTSYRRPLQLIYSKEFATRGEATVSERYLKSAEGGSLFKKNFLGKQYFNNKMPR